MCGFTGFYQSSSQSASDLTASLVKMTNAISHRGPDDSGTWVDVEKGIALGHRRLSILDLSPHGHQPMVSVCSRYVIVYNGEIYNFQNIRAELEKDCSIQWRGHSDTEIILAAFERWGIESALTRFNGMFAFALWDKQESILHLSRDRFGEKPLYYGWMGDTFIFGSELKALKLHPSWRGEIDRDSLALYTRHNYVPSPYSIYKGIYKLLPAHILSISFKSGERELPPLRSYWSAKVAVEAGAKNPFTGTEPEGVKALDSLLLDAVSLRMVSDVPLGAFLSGGIDSSTIVALMQAQSKRPIKTFTIGFNEAGYNEAEHAKAVAKHLGTDHTELYVTPAESMAIIPQLPRIYDEPFADSSQIPTFLVSQMTRKSVTVALSGDAGDELFAGYNRYLWGQDIWSKIRWMPKVMRKTMAKGLTSLPSQKWDEAFSSMMPFLPKKMRASLPGDKVHKLAGVLDSSSPEDIYRGLVSFWNPKSVILSGAEKQTVLTDPRQWADLPNFTERMMFMDVMSYLPDDILAKVDRAAMAVSLEGRVPMLDHRIAEFAWKLPLSMKLKDNQGKWILKQVLYKYVPQSLVERPKMGFGVPIDSWLRGPLREWAETYLSEVRLEEEGFFNVKEVRLKWHEHLYGNRNWSSLLWNILMFQTWHESQHE